MSGRETIDLSPVGKEILEHRAARRNKLRYEYLKQTQNPYRHGLGIGGCVDDVGVNRLMAMKVSASHFFKPSWKNASFMLAVCIIPIVTFTYGCYYERKQKEHRLRTGQVSYRDREYKFN
ncbi:uncharacterized protein LOC106693044 isoform X1 [Microplitis demolitor]|uniref:uncharacterized protein LOC106693044 isoform X1 n=1 Tax=Microplitis demolitor TaxID=69319 RepID=UPI0004CDD6F0|nr:uncharacterized protein LOC106693044 isoform X1 [Microplitis demolitor]